MASQEITSLGDVMNVDELQTDYAGRKTALFGLALKTSFFTVLTLGFYRFWMKTRMRRFYWSAIRPGGQPLEYVGRPTEKLLGFLSTVVFLAFYIGIVNLILVFLSFSFLRANQPAYLLSFLGLVPIIFFAQYRARRYILARTRWRGIRFGLAPGVSGFVWRSLLHWGLTVVTLGLYWPVKTFHLEKYRTDRTWYGDQNMRQNGKWTLLLAPMKHVYLGVASSAVCGVIVWVTASIEVVPFLFLTVAWSMFGLAYWKAYSFKRLTEAKQLGNVRLATDPSVWRIIGIYVAGYSLISVVVLLGVSLLLAFSSMIFVALATLLGEANDGDVFSQLSFASLGVDVLPLWVVGVVWGASYFAAFLFWRTLTETFITLPLARHFAEVTSIIEPAGLNTIRQRDRDEFAEAEGFADALPLGEGM
ncbi:MAG: DUF898 family protein [Maritimibacter sp.]